MAVRGVTYRHVMKWGRKLKTDRLTGRPTDRRTDRPTGRPDDRPAGRPTGRRTDRPTDRPTGRPADRPADRPTDGPTDQERLQPFLFSPLVRSPPIRPPSQKIDCQIKVVTYRICCAAPSRSNPASTELSQWVHLHSISHPIEAHHPSRMKSQPHLICDRGKKLFGKHEPIVRKHCTILKKAIFEPQNSKHNLVNQ